MTLSEVRLTTAVDHDPFAGPELALTAPVTPSQQELWTAAQMGREASCAFNESNTLRFAGPLDVGALRTALQDLVQRHEALRTTLSSDGRTLCIAAASVLEVPLHDLSALRPEEQQARTDRLLGREVQEPFDLERGPLLRALLIRLGPEAHLLGLTAHHIVCDGWSTGVMMRDLAALYTARHRGAAPQLEEAFPFSAYARERLDLEATPEHLAVERWWLDRFAGEIPSLDLPFDAVRPPLKTYSSAREDHVLPAELVVRLRRLAAGSGASLFTVLLAGFQALLHRLSAERDLVVGILSAGQATSGHPGLVGHCVNTLPIRQRMEGTTSFRALVIQTRTAVLDASEHGDHTYGSLLSSLPLRRDPSRLPLVSVLFNLDQEISAGDLPFEGVAVSFASTPRRFETFDLFLNAVEAEGELRLECQYNTDLVEARTARRWLETLEVLLRAAVEDPEQQVGRLPVLSEPERAQLRAWNDTRLDYPRGLQVHQLVEFQAERTPDAIAVVFEGEELSYAELDRRANRLAHRLRALGVTRNVLVGLFLERSLEMAVALLAVGKAGGGYVPLDPAYPRERIGLMIRGSRMHLLVTEESVRARLPECPARVLSLDGDRAAIAAESDAVVPAAAGASSEDVVYVIYTSGSTGTPKGVLVPHRAVVNLLTSARHRPGMGAGDVVVALATLSFDIAVCELWLPLSVGARVVIARREVAADGERLLDLVRRSGATVLQATPTTWRLLIGAGWSGGEGLVALCTGEAFPPDLAADLLGRAAQVWNMYGPTETTVWSSHHRLTGAEAPVLIGGPLANTQLHVLDEWLQPVPVGVRGELYIGGDGVTLGYHDRAELTAERFLPDPFSDEAGARMYRTGDVARWRPDGSVEYLGRNDHQVKIRGYRIELGEIEAVLAQHPSVAQAVAVAREDRPGDVRLTGYAVLRPGAAWSVEELRDHLQRLLPDHMVPRHLVRMDALPLTPSGKVDRGALPAPEAEASATLEYVAPSSEAEVRLAEIWQEVLGIGRLGIHDDFFQLGGHSLLAAQAVSLLARRHGIALPVRQMFETPTIARLAPLLAEQRKAVPIPRRAGDRPAPATAMQRRIWLLDRLGYGRSFNLPGAWRLRGRLDHGALRRSVEAFVTRHEATRTVLRPDGDDLVLHVAPRLEVDLTPVDLATLPAEEREAELMRRLLDASEVPFDITAGPLFRISLFRLDAEEHVLFVLPHNAVWDGWCFDILHHELDATYRAFTRGEPSPLAPLPVQYSDFATWHERWLQGPEVAGQAAYWHRQLAGELRPLELPTDRPRSRIVGEDGATEWMTIPRDQADRLTALGRREEATLYMVLLAAYATLLHRYSGQDDFLVGTAVRGRHQPEVEDLVGLFIKDVVLRTRFDSDPSFLEMLRRVRATVLDAFTHQDPHLESLGLARQAAYRAAFYFQDARNRPRTFGDLALDQVHVLPPAAATDLRIWMILGENGLVGGLNYTTELFDASTVRQLLAGFRTLLGAVLDDPTRAVSSLAIVPEEARRAIVAGGAPAAPATPAGLVGAPFEAQAGRRPTAVAVAAEAVSMTYGQLDACANVLAGRLRRRGVGPEERVAICASPGAERVVAILAVARAGGAAVLLDPAEPEAWTRRVLADARPLVVLAEPGAPEVPEGSGSAVVTLDAAVLDPGEGAEPPAPLASPDDLALIAYTSGPDGGPLGVELTHRALSTAVEAVRQAVGLGEGARLVATDPVASGRSALELWLALGAGAALIPADASDLDSLCEVMERRGATALHADPAVWRLLVDAGWTGGDGFLALSSGGPMTSALAGELASRTGRAHSLHGMAETGFWSGLASLGEGTAAEDLGLPLGDGRWHVVDRALEAVLPGLPGELLVGGATVARGYRGSPRLTAGRFVPDPSSGRPEARMIRTGDRVRVRGGDRVELLGVEDGRLAVGGRRVEAVEVERALEQHPAVREAAVSVHEEWDERRLVAHVVHRPGMECTGSELRGGLRGLLPAHMVPRRFLELDALPRRQDGSIDRARLAAPRAAAAETVGPRTGTERLLAGLWREALGVAEVSVHDNFFDLGGHSLLCLQVIAQLEERTAQRVDPRLLLLNTLEQAAARLAPTLDMDGHRASSAG
jgi:amino acid adenylation domain-containing protein